MESFFDYYELYNSTTRIENKFDKNITEKTCKFCSFKHPEVSFNNIPHIIPELFGKNNITSNFECDTCNSKFQKYESDTATMIQHYLTLMGIKSKNKIPTFQSEKTIDTYSTILKTIENHRSINFGTNLSDFEYDEPNKKLTVRFRTKKFRPFSVYKVFLKIGVALLNDEDVKENKHFLEFLNSDEPIKNGMQVWTVFRYMLKTKYIKIPTADLYKAKKVLIDNTEFPEYILILQFGNIMYQFLLPISEKNMGVHKAEYTLRIEMFPSFAFDDITRISKIDIYNMNLDETKKVSITDEVVLHYDLIKKDSQ